MNPGEIKETNLTTAAPNAQQNVGGTTPTSTPNLKHPRMTRQATCGAERSGGIKLT